MFYVPHTIEDVDDVVFYEPFTFVSSEVETNAGSACYSCCVAESMTNSLVIAVGVVFYYHFPKFACNGIIDTSQEVLFQRHEGYPMWLKGFNCRRWYIYDHLGIIVPMGY